MLRHAHISHKNTRAIMELHQDWTSFATLYEYELCCLPPSVHFIHVSCCGGYVSRLEAGPSPRCVMHALYGRVVTHYTLQVYVVLRMHLLIRYSELVNRSKIVNHMVVHRYDLFERIMQILVPQRC